MPWKTYKPRLRQALVLLPLLSLPLLTACATSVPVKQPIILTNSQFTCKEKPDVPADGDIDGALGRFILQMEFAADDCRDQLAEVKNVLEVQGATITDVLVTDTQTKKGFWPFK